MSVIMKLVGLVCGQPTEHDGKYLVEYDPTRQWVEDGVPTVHLISTEDPAEAKRYAGLRELRADWAWEVEPRRPDGKPNRPLTAFTIEVVNAPEGGSRG